MKPKRCFVTVVATVADAESFVESFVRECLAVLRAHYRDFELILVDDASTDGTVAEVDRLLKGAPALRLVRLARPFGPDVALTAGLDSAIGDYIVLMQPERDPPGEIPALVRLAEEGFGVVTGVAPNRPGEPVWKRATRRGFYAACNRVLGIRYPRDATRFQALTRAAAGAAGRARPKCPQFPVLAAQVGYGGATHAYRTLPHRGGRRAPGLRGMLDRALSVVVMNSMSPLRLVSYLGIGAGLMNLLYACYVVGVNLFKSHVAEGWTTLSLQMSGMFFLVFLILVMACEYIGRTLEEAQDRPVYHVLEERNGSEQLQLTDRRNVLERSEAVP
jgi:glycosyltransferase involved in cell wall biosynthesis